MPVDEAQAGGQRTLPVGDATEVRGLGSRSVTARDRLQATVWHALPEECAGKRVVHTPQIRLGQVPTSS